jgi:hypothetical protein
LEERDSSYVVTKTRWENAEEHWDYIEANPSVMLARAQAHSPVTLNPTPLEKTSGRNEVAGTVTYQWAYNDRASFATAGALSEVVTFQFKNPADIIARLGVLGREAGPVLQDIGSKSESSLTVTADIVVPPARYGQAAPSMPTFDFLAAALPYIGSYTKLFAVDPDQGSWVPAFGRYSRSVTYLFEN